MKERRGGHSGAKAHKSQTAIEYLMTYGWSILIMSMVFAAFFVLGPFRVNFGPKAQPGMCKVMRNSITGPVLQGLCNNEEPQYVGVLDTAGGNGRGFACMNMTVPTLNLNSGGYNTVNFWMYWNGKDNESLIGFPGYFFLMYSGCIGFTTGNKDVYGVGSGGLADKWTMVTLEFYNGPFSTNNRIYIDGGEQNPYQCTGTSHTGTAKNNLLIGSSTGSKYIYTGQVTNLQIYNTSLDNTSIKALYDEGMGGDPFDLADLVAWVPLNGNANDYGGYSYLINASSNSCSASYTAGYSSP